MKQFNIGIDCRFIFPKMDGIGRYLYHLTDSITELTADDKLIRFTALEVAEFKDNSALRSLEGRKNLSFAPVDLKPLGLKNHLLESRLASLEIDLLHYGQFDLPWFLKTPAITNILDLNPQFFPGFFEGASGKLKQTYSRVCNRIALEKSLGILVISGNTKDELVNIYGERFADKIRVAYLGVDDGFAAPDVVAKAGETLTSIKAKFSLDKYFLYVGNNRPHKNLHGMLEAFSRFRAKDKQNYKFVIAGSMMDRFGSVEQYAVKYGLQGSIVQLTPNEIELKALYLGARALFYCSFSEGFGLPIVEAMSLGTPVITSSISSMGEIAGSAAITVDPHDVEAMTSTLLSAATGEEYLLPLREKGKVRAAEFTWKRCAEDTLSYYLEILKKIRK